MIIAGVREFRDRATKMLRSREPVLIIRRGEVAGLYFPYPTRTLPMDFKRELFEMITKDIGRRLKEAGVTEGDLLSDVKETKKTRRRR